MSWSTYTDPAGVKWSINYSNVANVINAYSYVAALAENASIKVESAYHGFGSDQVEMRKLNYLKFEEKTVKARASEISKRMYQAFLMMLTTSDKRSPDNFLAGLRARTLKLRGEHADLVSKSNEMNKAYLQQATTAVENARAVRDASALLLTVIASVASGGTAAAAATLATGATAVGKYQDTGSASEAAKAGATALITLGWGQLANFTKGMEAGSKVIFFTLGVTVDMSANIAMSSNSTKSLKQVTSEAALQTLTNAAFFGVDVGFQKLLAKEVGMLASHQELWRFLYQAEGRLVESAIKHDLSKPKPTSTPKGAATPHLSHEPNMFSFIHQNCIRRVN